MRQCLRHHQNGWRICTAPRSRGAGSPAPGDEPEVKRRREASSIVIQGITDELRAFGAVVGPKFMHCATQEAKGIEINQLDLKDAVVSEVFCKNRWMTTITFFTNNQTEMNFGTSRQFKEF